MVVQNGNPYTYLRRAPGALRRGRDARQRRPGGRGPEARQPDRHPDAGLAGALETGPGSPPPPDRAVQRSFAPPRALARRATAAAPGRRRLHRRGSPRRSSACYPARSRWWPSVPAAAPVADGLRGARRGPGAGFSAPPAGGPKLPDLPGEQSMEPAGRPASGRCELGWPDRQHRARHAGSPGLRDRLRRRPERDPVRGRLRANATRPGVVPVRRRIGPRAVSDPAERADRGRPELERRSPRDRGRPGDLHRLRAVQRLPAPAAGRTGPRAPVRSSTCARTVCVLPAGPPPTPPGFRSSPAWRATTRWHAARSTTRSGSRPAAPPRATSIPHVTRRRRAPASIRRWDCGCG